MKGWNYRAIEFTNIAGDSSYVAIHEVYYDDDGKPCSYSSTPASVYADSDVGISSMQKTLQKMQEALNKPILKSEIFNS